MAVILIRCPCGRAFTVTEAVLGTWIRCPQCGNMNLVRWPKRQEEAPPEPVEQPDEERLLDELPEPGALNEIVEAEDERAPDALTRTRCLGCGRPIRRRRALCLRCRTVRLLGRRPTEPVSRRTRRAVAGKRKGGPVTKALVLNVPFALFAVYLADQALSARNPAMALGAMLVALVPVGTIQVFVLAQAGAILRVKNRGLEPAAHATVLALGLQLLIGALGYLATLAGHAVGGAPTAAIVGLSAVGLAVLVGWAVVARILRSGLLRGLILSALAAAVIGLAAIPLEPVGRIFIEWVPDVLTPATQPAATQPAAPEDSSGGPGPANGDFGR